MTYVYTLVCIYQYICIYMCAYMYIHECMVGGLKL